MSSISISSSLQAPLKKLTMPSEVEPEEAVVHPDSTTPLDKERPAFSHGQDVLLKHKDGRYYLGTVVETDTIREQCLVKFGDNTEAWSGFKDLTKLSMPDEDLLCVVCKKSGDKFEVKVCDKCGRGYHMGCHQPEIPAECQKEGSTWMCKKCVDCQQIRYLTSTEKTVIRKDSIRKICSGADVAVCPPSDRSRLPYDPDLLNWDTYHRVNIEQIYCYCGKNGEWYTQMLQCGRCRQWFHEKCVRCLKFPLYCGDRFYVFVCSICNNGKEFVRRLELKWVDMVHLMLFNLTAYNVKKYYDLDTIILPYMNDNWYFLQLPPKIHSVSKAERRENILSVLTNNRNRFKCGREIKKRTTIWGLRVRLPPPAPCVTLPSTGTISEEGLRERWEGNKRLQFIPVVKEEEVFISEEFDFKLEIKEEDFEDADDYKTLRSDDATMMRTMRGTAYQTQANLSETESPCPSPNSSNNALILSETADRIEEYPGLDNKLNYHGGGYVKKSVPFPKINVQRRKRFANLNVRERDKILRRAKQKQLHKQKRKFGAKKQTSLESKKDCRFKNKTRRLNLRNRKKPEDNVPLTPPTSVSAPPTPPASSTPLLLTNQPVLSNSEVSSEYALNSADLAQNLQNLSAKKGKNVVSNADNLELNTPCSSGDETSSKSTLDQIIPPPKDFEGKNNPFHALLKGALLPQGSQPSAANLPSPKSRITLPLPLTAVIPSAPVGRPMKRQLSEKDICIGPNGEVKRKRLRRRTLSTVGQTASKTATVVPTHPDSKDWTQRTLRSNNAAAVQTPPTAPNNNSSNCVDYVLNGRRLRQRLDPTKNQETTQTTSTPASTKLQTKLQQPIAKLSPVKQEEITLDDLKSSVNIYFGAANRIAAGERFSVKARRIGPKGKVQYLIEWDGSQGMT